MKDLDKYNLVFQEFCEWVGGIEEDDPFPPEIKQIYFVFSCENGMNVLQYAGCEYEPKMICSFDYFTLEAQFFYSREFIKLPSAEAKRFAEIFARDILQREEYANLFLNKTVKFVELGQMIKRI